MATPEEKRIVVIATDGSDHSDYAFDYYLQHVRKENDSVCLVNVPESYDLTLASPATVDSIVKDLKKKLKIIEDKSAKKIQENKLHGKFRTGQGKPGEVICQLAKEEKADLIVIGTRGLGKIRRTFLGSVSDFVVHHADMPVLVCRQETKGKHDDKEKQQKEKQQKKA